MSNPKTGGSVSTPPRKALLRHIGLLLALAAISGCGRQPEKPLELRLALSKRQWKAGEYIWYRLELKNVGRKSVRIQDPFWRRQSALFDWADRPNLDTHFEIIGPDGKKAPHLAPPCGHHAERCFWINDCGGGEACVRELTDIKLKGGDTLVATPSMVAPIRPRDPDAWDPGDMRALPEIPAGMSKEKVQTLQRNWKKTVEQSGWLMGDPGFRPEIRDGEVVYPKGYRVLEAYIFNKPGIYKMKAVYVPFSLTTTAEDMRSGMYTFKDAQWPEETKVFVFESNTVEFEVVPVPFPEHLFRKHLGAKETAADQMRTDLIRNKLRKAMERNASLLKKP